MSDEKKTIAVIRGEAEQNKKKLIEAVAGVFGFAAALGGPYMMPDTKDFLGRKHRRVVAVLKCRVCGATNRKCRAVCRQNTGLPQS